MQDSDPTAKVIALQEMALKKTQERKAAREREETIQELEDHSAFSKLEEELPDHAEFVALFEGAFNPVAIATKKTDGEVIYKKGSFSRAKVLPGPFMDAKVYDWHKENRKRSEQANLHFKKEREKLDE